MNDWSRRARADPECAPRPITTAGGTEAFATPAPITIRFRLLPKSSAAPRRCRFRWCPGKQLYISDLPLPIAPQAWHYRQSIDYEMENNRAILDYASKNRETLLYNFYRMGMNSIERGSRDNWTITPKRIDALREAAAKLPARGAGTGRRSAGGWRCTRRRTRRSSRSLGAVRKSPARSEPTRSSRLYHAAPISPIFATATKFVNSLLKNGLTVLKASARV